MDSNFKFLAREFQLLFNLAQSAEKYIYQGPNVALYKLRLKGKNGGRTGRMYVNKNIRNE